MSDKQFSLQIQTEKQLTIQKRRSEKEEEENLQKPIQIRPTALKTEIIQDQLNQASKNLLSISNQDLYESVGYFQKQSGRATAKTQFKENSSPGQSLGIVQGKFQDGGRLTRRNSPYSPTDLAETTEVHISVIRSMHERRNLSQYEKNQNKEIIQYHEPEINSIKSSLNYKPSTSIIQSNKPEQLAFPPQPDHKFIRNLEKYENIKQLIEKYPQGSPKLEQSEQEGPNKTKKRSVVTEELSMQKEKLMKHRIKHQRSHKHDQHQDRYELQKIDANFVNEAQVQAEKIELIKFKKFSIYQLETVGQNKAFQIKSPSQNLNFEEKISQNTAEDNQNDNPNFQNENANTDRPQTRYLGNEIKNLDLSEFCLKQSQMRNTSETRLPMSCENPQLGIISYQVSIGLNDYNNLLLNPSNLDPTSILNQALLSPVNMQHTVINNDSVVRTDNDFQINTKFKSSLAKKHENKVKELNLNREKDSVSYGSQKEFQLVGQSSRPKFLAYSNILTKNQSPYEMQLTSKIQPQVQLPYQIRQSILSINQNTPQQINNINGYDQRTNNKKWINNQDRLQNLDISTLTGGSSKMFSEVTQ